MSEQLIVPPEYAVDVLCRTELGKALWQAAQLGALAEIQHARIAELEQRQTAGVPPTPGDTDV